MKTLRTILILFLASVLASPAFAALSASIVWEIRAAGNDTNGGFYLAGAGTDYSLSDTPLVNVTDGVTAGTTTVTSATANFPADCVNNGIWISGGTGVVAPGWYQVITRTSATDIVVDRTTGLTAGTGVSLRLGGAMASLGGAVFSGADTQTMWVKSGTYTMTTTTPGAAGPVVLQTSEVVTVRGYVSTRGDASAANIASMPVISAGAQTGITLFSAPSTSFSHNLSFLKVDGNAGAANIGFSFGSNSPGLKRLLEAVNCPGTAGFIGGGMTLYECRAVGNAVGFSAGVQNLFGCSAIGNTGNGFTNTGGGVLVRPIAHGNGGDGIGGSGNNLFIVNPTTDGNTGDGIDLGAARCTVVNALSTNNTGFGLNVSSATTTAVWNYASMANSARYNTTPSSDVNPILVLVDPYVALASDDFRPNTAATGGALLRAVGSGPFGQTNNNDIGAVQHTDPTGGPARLINGGLIR